MQPSKQSVAQDLPLVLGFLRAIEPSMGGATLSETVELLDLATKNDAALSLVADAALGARPVAKESRRG